MASVFDNDCRRSGSGELNEGELHTSAGIFLSSTISFKDNSRVGDVRVGDREENKGLLVSEPTTGTVEEDCIRTEEAGVTGFSCSVW